MPDLDWRILDEQPEEDAPPLPEEPAPPKRSRWPLALLALLAAGGIALAYYWQVFRPVEAAKDRATAGALAAFWAVQAAVEKSDAERFDSLLAHGDFLSDRWANALNDLFAMNLLFDRSVLGLQSRAGAPRVLGVELSRELDEARISFERAYTVETGNGQTETVALQEIAFFRFDADRWLWSPPAVEYWGKQATLDGQVLSMRYPERDREIAERLARDLDAALIRVCGSLDCPARLHVDLLLDPEPSRLLQLMPPSSPWVFANEGSVPSPRHAFALPAPSLVGVPVDEAGYQALYRGYGFVLVRRLFESLSAYGSTGPSYAAFNAMAIQLGLRSWPMVAIEADPAPPPLPWSDQDLWLTCAAGTGGGSVFRYDPPSGVWRRDISDRDIVSVTPLPDGGLLLRERVPLGEGAGTRFVLRGKGEERVLMEAPASVYAFTDPTGRRLAVVIFPRGRWTSASELMFQVFDIGECGSGGCALTSLPGEPVWSPDGSQMLVIEGGWAYSTGRLLRGDGGGNSLSPAAEGVINPFWIDEQTYAYFRRVPVPRTGPRLEGLEIELFVASTADDAPQRLFALDELVRSLPGAPDSSPMSGAQVVPSPADPDLLLINVNLYESSWSGEVSGPRPGQALVVLYDWRTGETSLRMRLDGESAFASFSPDGRWLAVHSGNATGGAIALRLHNVVGNETRATRWDDPYATPGMGAYPAWSADGRWLSILNDGVLTLIAPDHDYRRAVVPPVPGCVSATWGRDEN